MQIYKNRAKQTNLKDYLSYNKLIFIMNNKTKIVNKFGKDRSTAEALFTDIARTALGEIVVVNDSKLPALLIKDNNLDTYEIHGVSVKGNAGTTEGDVKVAPEIKSGQTIYTVTHTGVNLTREEEEVPEDNITIVTGVDANPLGHITKVKTGKISFKTINDEIANIREELENVGGEYGTAIEMVDEVINVKVQENNNFLEVNDNNELVVESINTNKTIINEDITIAGGPLAELAKQVYTGGTVPQGTDIQTFLKNLLCVEIYPSTSKNTPTFSISISSPTISIPNGLTKVGSDYLAEVGQTVAFSSVTANSVSVSKTEPKVSGFEHGYSSTIDGVINTQTAITSSWSISHKSGEVYKLSASKTGFGGTIPSTVSSTTAGSCILSTCSLVAAEGANTYTVSETAPKYVGSFTGIDSKYIVSNLKGRSEDKKSQAIASQTNVEETAENKSTTFTVIGVCPIYTNGVTASTTDSTAATMADLGAPVSDYGTKLGLMKADSTFALSFAHQDLEPYSVCLPGNWKITSAKAIDPLTKTYAVDCKAKFVSKGTITKTIQGKEVTYTVYSYGESAGPNRVKFTVG